MSLTCNSGDDRIGQAHAAMWAVTAIASVVLVGFVCAFGLYGEQLTQGVDIACADAAFQWGKRHEQLGNIQQAVRYYRQALTGHVLSTHEMHECAISLGNVLCRQQLYEEAVEAYSLVPEEAYVTAGSLTGYVKSLRLSKRFDKAERLAHIWLDKARDEKDYTQALWANAALGHIYKATNHPERALTYFMEATAIDSTSPAAIHAARLLHEQGKREEALTHIDAFLQRVTTGRLHDDAVRCRRQIEQSPR